MTTTRAREISKFLAQCTPAPLESPAWAHFDAAVEAIAALPVDKVEAMAALVSPHSLGIYCVPGGEDRMPYCVASYTSGLECDCKKQNCIHVKAVKLYLEQSAGGQPK